MYKLRPYQEVAIEKALVFFKDSKSTNKVIVSPVGSGKSIYISEIARRLNKRLLVFCPNKELIQQNFEKYSAYGFINAGVFSASLKMKEIHEVTFSTIGSAVNQIDRFRGFELCIVDECHNISPEKETMYQRFFEGSGIKKVLGLTATPMRLQASMTGSKVHLITNQKGKFFKEILHIVSVSEMVKNGYWSKLKYAEIAFSDEYLKPNSTGAEFTQESVKIALIKNNVNATIVNHLGRVGNRSCLIFSESVDEAYRMAKNFSDASVITTETNAEERGRIVELFKRGRIKKLFNYNCFKEGFDYPDLDIVMIGRPTRSLTWYLQVCGRVVRKAPIDKVKTIVDYCGNMQRFGKIEEIDIKPVQASKNVKYEIFRGNILLTGIDVSAIGSKILVDGVVHDRKFARSTIPKGRETESFTMTMPFGKHQGKTLKDLPKTYLEYVVEQSWCQDFLKREAVRRGIHLHSKGTNDENSK